MQIERDTLCRLIEDNAPAFDELTGIPVGGQVEALADKILAHRHAAPDDAVERVARAIHADRDAFDNAVWVDGELDSWSEDGDLTARVDGDVNFSAIARAAYKAIFMRAG